MEGFVEFMAKTPGRWIRIVAGGVMITAGLVVGGTGGIVVAVAGLLALAAGAFDFCTLAPLFGEPFSGKRVRARS